MKNRTMLREIIVKVLYQVYILDNAKIEYNIEDLIKEQMEIENEFVNKSVNDVIKYQKEITDMANKYLDNWTIDRLSKVDKAILSLGIYELMYTNTPSIVCINETIELSKLYSDSKVTNMINACMDKIYKEELDGRK
ncbi:MAG: transcription antitermination factor NusB [Bacilli bacterium]|nr:transcription antitermination factor NusB [Bacilli bacterium]